MLERRQWARGGAQSRGVCSKGKYDTEGKAGGRSRGRAGGSGEGRSLCEFQRRDRPEHVL